MQTDPTPFTERLASLVTDPVFWITTVGLGLVIGVGGNLLTDACKKAWNNYVVYQRKSKAIYTKSVVIREIARTQREIERLTNLHSNQGNYIVELLQTIVTVLFGLFGTTIVVTTAGLGVLFDKVFAPEFWYIAATITAMSIFFINFGILFRTVKTMSQLRNYDIVKEELEKELTQLQLRLASFEETHQ
jgi:hypothetical protein